MRLIGGLAAAAVFVVAVVVVLRAVPDRGTVPPQPSGQPATVASSSAPAPAETEPPPARRVLVTYEVTGPGAATMSYTDGASRRVDMPAMSLPWRHDELAEASFMAAAVSGASTEPTVRLGCRIWIDGQKVAGMTGLGTVACTQGD
jgi:Mycobacterium membrane protein.